jgi:hypothetical protein
MSTVVKSIDGLTVHATPLPIHPHGFILGAELAAIAAPALAKLEPVIKGVGLGVDDPSLLPKLLETALDGAGLGFLVDALALALGSIGDDRARAERVTRQLLRCLVVEAPDANGRLAMAELSSDAAVNAVVGRSWGRYLKLLRFALEVNVGGPFGAASPASSPTTPDPSFRAG